MHGPGEKDAETLLFIHGWPDSAALWAQQIPFFVAKGFRCLVVTLPNHDGVGEGWGADFDALRQQLEDVVREHVPTRQRVTLFLHDWGCTLGYQLAHVCRVLGFTPFSCVYGVVDPAWRVRSTVPSWFRGSCALMSVPTLR